jgi:hypothetical protein
MTVEVIKSGRAKDRPYTATCGPCGCVFKFLESDAVSHWDQRDGNFLEIRCPECHFIKYVGKTEGHYGPG